jgi:gliding motility-associated-like protein/uncharacterized repeat protein (TIGR01451 family)
MKNFYTSFKTTGIFALLVILFSGLNILPSVAQNDNRVPFSHRVGIPAPQNNIHTIRGDFTIIGNTNLTLTDPIQVNNSNNQMKYVDVDNNPLTINSSSATLVFSEENNADPNCSQIIYAGLYWSGRAVPSSGFTFDVIRGSQPGAPQAINNEIQIASHNNPITYSSYSLEIERRGLENNRFPRFTFSSGAGGDTHQFEFSNSTNNPARYRLGTTAAYTTLNNQVSQIIGDVRVVTFDPIVIQDGDMILVIDRLSRNISTTGEVADYQTNDNSVRVTASGTYIPTIFDILTLDKRRVKLKGPQDLDYRDIVTGSNQILYPNGELEDIFVGYADVTAIVKNQGIGEYSVADIAISDGNGGPVGYFGHWGMVIIYENSKMNWRDVTVFDGYSFLRAPSDRSETTGELLIDGFRASPNGPINLKLGVMAGEGDRGLSGDFLEIRNAADTEWVRLRHPLNTINNFFNSSIYTPVTNNLGNLALTPRTPNFTNNTGIDIAMWEIPNEENFIIQNNQTTTKFRYGSTQDVYTIYTVAFSVDAYVPDIQGFNQISTINNQTVGSTSTVKPGEELTYTLEIRNLGTETISDAKVVIPIPYTASFVSVNSEIFFSPNQAKAPYFDPTLGATGSIVWELGNLPLKEDIQTLLAKLTYSLKATQDCFILANGSCDPFVSVSGSISGKGDISQTEFSGIQLVQGFLEGACEGEPIQTPLVIPISGASEWVDLNCSEAELFKDFFFCNIDTSSGLPIDLIKDSFPLGTRFFDGRNVNSAVEYTEANPFPGTNGTYYAIPANSTDCVYEFKITVSVINSSPDVPEANDLVFCQGVSLPNLNTLIQASNAGQPNEYEIYFFTQAQGGPVQLGYEINSTVVGSITIWVAEGVSSTCIGPRVPVTITIQPNAPTPSVTNQVVCQGSGEIPFLAQANEGFELLYFGSDEQNAQPLSAIPFVDTQVAGNFEVWVSQTGSNFCNSQKIKVSIVVTEGPNAPISGGNQSQCYEEGSLLTATASVEPGFSIVWYDQEGTVVQTPSLNTLGTVTYFAETVRDLDNCVSVTRTPVTLSLNTCSIELEKTGEWVDKNNDNIPNAGDEIVYTFTITNNSPYPFEQVQVIDPKVTVAGGILPSLAPGATDNSTFTAIYVLLQADIDAGIFINVAQVKGILNGEEASATDEDVQLFSSNPALDLVKTSNKASVSTVGEIITYTLTVTNVGNVTLSNVELRDPLTNLVQLIPTILPGQQIVVNTLYNVTQADLDKGSIINTATIAGKTPKNEDTSATDELIIPVVQQTGVAISKVANRTTFTAVGDEIIYTISVTNTGNVTLNNIIVRDPLTNFEQNIGSLAPGETKSVTTTYNVKQEDLTAGKVRNVAYVGFENEDEEEEDENIVVIENQGKLQVIKTADQETYSEIGQKITYTIQVTNTGNVTLVNIVVSDPLTGFNQSIASLTPGQSVSFTTTYLITLADLEAGFILNVAKANGEDPAGKPIDADGSITIGKETNQIIAIDDDLGEHSLSYGGVIGNILNNDLLNGRKVNDAEVDFEFTELDGIIGLLINDNGELTLVPGVNEARSYRLKYTLTEVNNPLNSDDAWVTFKLFNDDVNLSISKTSNGSEIFEGDEFEYEIRIGNLGTTPAANVEIIDDLPSGVTYIGFTFESNISGLVVTAAINGAKVTFSISELPAGGNVLIKLKVRANALPTELPLTITNVVRATSTQTDTNNNDNTATDVNQIKPFFIGNVITPNGDGKNDRFVIKGIGKFPSNELIIFNRYGDHVYESKNYQNNWAAEGLNAGTYFYVLRGKDVSGKDHEFKGWIQVIKK